MLPKNLAIKRNLTMNTKHNHHLQTNIIIIFQIQDFFVNIRKLFIMRMKNRYHDDKLSLRKKFYPICLQQDADYLVSLNEIHMYR